MNDNFWECLVCHKDHPTLVTALQCESSHTIWLSRPLTQQATCKYCHSRLDRPDECHRCIPATKTVEWVLDRMPIALGEMTLEQLEIHRGDLIQDYEDHCEQYEEWDQDYLTHLCNHLAEADLRIEQMEL